MNQSTYLATPAFLGSEILCIIRTSPVHQIINISKWSPMLFIRMLLLIIIQINHIRSQLKGWEDGRNLPYFLAVGRYSCKMLCNSKPTVPQYMGKDVWIVLQEWLFLLKDYNRKYSRHKIENYSFFAACETQGK